MAPLGVLQFGSTQKIFETPDFVDHAKTSFQTIDRMLPGNASTSLNRELHDQSQAESYIFSSGSSNYGNNKPLHHCRGKELSGNTQSAMVIPQPSPINMGYQTGSATPSSYSFQLKNQFQTTGSEAQVILAMPNNQMPQVLSQFTTSSANNPDTQIPMMSTWSTDGSMTSFEQEILCGMGIQEFPSILSVNSRTPQSCRSTSQNFQGHARGTNGLPNNVNNSAQMQVDTPDRNNYGKSETAQVSASLTNAIEHEILQGHTTFNICPGETMTSDDKTALSKPNLVDNLSQWGSQSDEQVNTGLITSVSDNLSPTGLTSASSGLINDEIFSGIPVNNASNFIQDSLTDTMNPLNIFYDGNEASLNLPIQLPTDNLFGNFGLDFGRNKGRESWDDIIMQAGSGSRASLSAGASECMSELDVGSMSCSQKGFFTDFGLEQFLEGVFSNVTSDTRLSSDGPLSTAAIGRERSAAKYPKLAGNACLGRIIHASLPECKLENTIHRNQSESGLKSRVSSWIDDSYSISTGSAAVTNPKRSEEPAKPTKKRARPGASTRPRPKDRQQIQDRVRELREIIPNGAKCSIDALLDRTIKHMLFLQSVARYADKLKQFNEPKITGTENSVILKDNSSEAGATWAFEVGCPTMFCPFRVQDLSPPGQMLVEMLCEEQGFFLEIADIIRGFGLTILKGIMEARAKKIWARFIVEASRSNISRMEIFLSLVQLLQQTSTAVAGGNSQVNKGSDGRLPECTNYQQPSMPLPVELADQLH